MVTLRALGTETSEDKCPPPGTYSAELVAVSDFERKPALKFKDTDPPMVNIQCRMEYQFFDYPYDADLDTQDWEGQTVTDFVVFQKEKIKVTKNADGTVTEEVEKVYDSYLDERSHSNKILKALMGRAPTREDDIDLESYIGTKLDIGIEPKDSGWPKFTSFARKRATRRQAASPKPEPVASGPTDDDLTGTAFDTDDDE
ncbi:MAG: hypothetical protein WBA46_01265 [Thermomicrobiales bacterium]